MSDFRVYLNMDIYKHIYTHSLLKYTHTHIKHKNSCIIFLIKNKICKFKKTTLFLRWDVEEKKNMVYKFRLSKSR